MQPEANSTNNPTTEIPDFLLKIIEGYSTYNKVYIKYWLTLALFSLIIIVSTNDKSTGQLALPFEIGKLEKNDFFPLSFFILAVLVLCFASAFSQSFRSAKLMYRVIESIKDDYIFPGDVHLKDIIDCLYYPSLTRVAPIAQLARGEHQFYPESDTISVKRKNLTTLYYVILKAVVVCVMYFLPIAALYISFLNGIWGRGGMILNIPTIVFWIIGITSLIVLFQLLIEDVKFLIRVVKHLYNP